MGTSTLNTTESEQSMIGIPQGSGLTLPHGLENQLFQTGKGARYAKLPGMVVLTVVWQVSNFKHRACHHGTHDVDLHANNRD